MQEFCEFDCISGVVMSEPMYLGLGPSISVAGNIFLYSTYTLCISHMWATTQKLLGIWKHRNEEDE